MRHKNYSCTLYLIRHAESEMNVKNYLVGGQSLDSILTQKGIEQANSLGQRLKKENTKIDFAYSSLAKRAYDTARISLGYLNYPLEKIIQIPELNELSQGNWEGYERNVVYNKDNLLYMNRKKSTFSPPNGESQKQVERRVSSWIEDNFIYNDEFVKNNNHKTIAIYSHGLAIKTFLRHVMNFDQHFVYYMLCENTSISEIVFNEKDWFVKRINDYAHIMG